MLIPRTDRNDMGVRRTRAAAALVLSIAVAALGVGIGSVGEAGAAVRDRHEGARATASSRSETARWATDGLARTSWRPTAEGRPWWQVDLGRKVFVEDILVRWAGPARPKTMRLFVSPDGRRFRSLGARSHGHGRWRSQKPARGRFLRIQMVTEGPTRVGISEVRVRDSSARVERAAGRPAGASSARADARRANDGRNRTQWVSARGRRHWWQVDLGQALPIDAISIRWGRGTTRRYTVRASNDGKRFRSVAKGRAPRAGWRRVRFHRVRARHVRIVARTKHPNRPIQLREVRVFGPNAQTHASAGPQGTPARHGENVENEQVAHDNGPSPGIGGGPQGTPAGHGGPAAGPHGLVTGMAGESAANMGLSSARRMVLMSWRAGASGTIRRWHFQGRWSGSNCDSGSGYGDGDGGITRIAVHRAVPLEGTPTGPALRVDEFRICDRNDGAQGSWAELDLPVSEGELYVSVISNVHPNPGANWFSTNNSWVPPSGLRPDLDHHGVYPGERVRFSSNGGSTWNQTGEYGTMLPTYLVEYANGFVHGEDALWGTSYRSGHERLEFPAAAGKTVHALGFYSTSSGSSSVRLLVNGSVVRETTVTGSRYLKAPIEPYSPPPGARVEVEVDGNHSIPRSGAHWPWVGLLGLPLYQDSSLYTYPVYPFVS